MPGFHETTKTSFDSYRRPDQVFAKQSVDLNDIMNQQSQYWARKNTAIGTSRNMGGMSTRRSTDFPEDPASITGEIDLFNNKINFNKDLSYKYPNFELKRQFEGKKFKVSNTHVSNMIVNRPMAATARITNKLYASKRQSQGGSLSIPADVSTSHRPMMTEQKVAESRMTTSLRSSKHVSIAASSNK